MWESKSQGQVCTHPPVLRVCAVSPCALRGQGQGLTERLEVQCLPLGGFFSVGDTEQSLLLSASSSHKWESLPNELVSLCFWLQTL